jgi:glyoxylase-like metal-dependent hydrolase (beta-lactamase superfamily II)
MIDFERLVAPNPGPMTLEGTNTYVVGREPAWVIDPGPDDAGHLERVRAAADERGGIGGVLLTHGHADHTEGVEALGAPLASESPFEAIPTPGHATDHVCLVTEKVCFCGDLILGHGSAIVPPVAHGGSLADYMDSLRLLAALELELLAPGHGELITDPAAKIAEYIEHREARERALVAALDSGERSRERLLESAWADVPAPMRPAAAMAMQAHLEKLEAEGVLASTELID